MMRRPHPRTVFTPTARAGPEMFATRQRGQIQDRLTDALKSPGLQIVVVGDTGVGKTNLVEHACRLEGLGVHRVPCGSERDFEALLRGVLGNLRAEYQTGRRVKSKTTTEVSGSIQTVLSGKHRSGSESEIEWARYERPLRSEVHEVLAAHGVSVLFLDNFEDLGSGDAADETKRAITRFMKYLSDEADTARSLRVIVAGIPAAGGELLSLSKAASRRTRHIQVPRMSPEELDAIIRNGERKLRARFDQVGRARVLQYAEGFPYWLHLIAQHTVHAALQERRSLGQRLGDVFGRTLHVTGRHFDAAIEEVLEDTHLDLKNTFDAVCESTGAVRPRRDTLYALASALASAAGSSPDPADLPLVNLKEIERAFLSIYPHFKDYGHLDLVDHALAELVELGVAVRLTYSEVGDLYRFAAPVLGAYANLRLTQESQSAVSLTKERAAEALRNRDPLSWEGFVGGILHLNDDGQSFALFYPWSKPLYLRARVNHRAIEEALREWNIGAGQQWSLVIYGPDDAECDMFRDLRTILSASA